MMIYKIKLCLLTLSLLVLTSSSIEDFEPENVKTLLPSRAESSELVELNAKGKEDLDKPENRAPAQVYVIGKFRTGPQNRPPNKRRNKQNQTRRARPRPNRFQVIQVQSNRKQTNIQLHNGNNRQGARKGNRRKNNKNNRRGQTPQTSTLKVAAAETFRPTFNPPSVTTILMPVLSFDPNFQDLV